MANMKLVAQIEAVKTALRPLVSQLDLPSYRRNLQEAKQTWQAIQIALLPILAYDDYDERLTLKESLLVGQLRSNFNMLQPLMEKDFARSDGNPFMLDNSSHIFGSMRDILDQLLTAAQRYPHQEAHVMKSVLQKGVKMLKDALDKKARLPVLSMIRVRKLHQNALVLQATNLEIAQQIVVRAKVDTDIFDCLIHFDTLSALLPLLSDNRVDLIYTQENCTLEMRCGANLTHLKGIAVEEFPMLPVPDENIAPIGIIHNTPQFVQYLKHVMSFAGKEDTNNVVLFKWNGQELVLAAQNGYTMSIATLKSGDVETSHTQDLYVYSKGIKALLDAVGKSTSAIRITATDNFLMCEFDGNIFTVQLADLKWQPISDTVIAEAQVDYLNPLIDVAKITKNGKGKLYFDFRQGELVSAYGIVDENKTEMALGFQFKPVETDTVSYLPLTGKFFVEITLGDLVKIISNYESKPNKTSLPVRIQIAQGEKGSFMLVFSNPLNDAVDITMFYQIKPAVVVRAETYHFAKAAQERLLRATDIALNAFTPQDQERLYGRCYQELMFTPATRAAWEESGGVVDWTQDEGDFVIEYYKALTNIEDVVRKTNVWTLKELLGNDPVSIFKDDVEYRSGLTYDQPWLEEHYDRNGLHNRYAWLDEMTVQEALERGVWLAWQRRKILIADVKKSLHPVDKSTEYYRNLLTEHADDWSSAIALIG